MPSSEPHPLYHLQHHNISPSHIQQHTPSAIEHQLFQQLVAVHHHQQQQQRQQQHGGPFQNSTYAQQKQEMSPEEEGGRGGGSPPAAGAVLHQPHHPRTASPPSGTEPCTRDAIPTPTPIADTTTTTTTTMTMQSQGQQQQQGPSPSPSPTGGDVEKFDGKIVYNPDGSAYIFEGESELSEDDSLPDGCIVDGRGVSVPHSLVFPQIANAYYVSRLYAHQAYQQQQQQQQQRSTAQQHNPDLPVMHSYRVISYRSAEGSKQQATPKFTAPPSPASVPIKPILMCFICKLSFGYAKSFVAHAQGEHQLTLMEDERQILSQSTASAIIQAVGRGKQPLVSFLEPVTNLACPQALPAQLPSQQQQQRNESNEHETTTTNTPASTPSVPSSPQQQQQQTQRPSPSTPTTPTSHSNHPLTYNHQQHQWTGAQVSAVSWAKAPDVMHYSSPPPSASSAKGSPSSYALTHPQNPPSYSGGTTIGVCADHMQGRPSGVECGRCELILATSRLASAGGPLAGIHSRNSCKTLKCPKCNWHYKYQETLEIHMKEKHPENETSCIYCIAGQPHPRLARGETYTCGYKPYRCEVCNYSTTTKGNLSIHMQSDKHLNNMQELQQGSGGSTATSNPSSSQEAPMPTRSPHHQQNHNPHLAAQSSNQSKPKHSFRCDVCNYETNVARNLRIHMTSEKHTHNSLVLHQNIKHMQTLSVLSQHHQAQQHHQQAQQHQQQLEQLLHLGGLDKPQHAEAALADMAYNQALLIQMMTGGPLPQQLPPEIMANMAAMTNLGGDVGLSPDSMEPPPEPADQDPSHLYHCCVCNNFATDSLEALGHHLAIDRTRTREGEILTVLNAHFICKLCSYKTNLKANFQLHCKTDKHLQRLQHVNHVKEGGPRNEWKLKYLASPTSAAQLRCHACDYYTNSAHKLALHAASPRHEAAALLLRHLIEASNNIQNPAKVYHCALCTFNTKHRLPLLQHVKSMRHFQMEQLHQLHRRSSLQGNETPHTDISDVFQVLSDPDAPSTQQPSPTTPTTPNATSSNNERREEGSECGSEVKQEPDNDPEPEVEPENDQDEITCLYCTYQPTSREELRQHLQVAHVDSEEKTETMKEEPTPELLCPLCQDGFKERPALEKHVMQIHSVNTDGLQRLLLLVDQSHWLNNPRNTSTPAVTVATTPTSPTTTTKPHQEEDMSERSGNDDIEEVTRTVCTVCGRTYRSPEDLQQHHRENHPATMLTLAVSEKHVYKYRCGQCSLAFKTLEKVQQHSQYHAIRDATKCTLCGRSFRSVQALQRHLESTHDLHEDDLLQYKQNLHAHPLFQALTEETLKRQNLFSEQNTEDDAGRGDEEESDASDSSPGGKEQRLLEDYLNSQTMAEDSYQDANRKFKCHRCKVAFTRQSYLTGHNKTLLHRKGEKMSYPMEKYLDPNRPYKCDVCKESFTQKNILLVHYNSVSHLHKLKRAMVQEQGNNTLISVVPPASPTESPDSQQDQDKKPYKCNICKVAYSQGSTLDIHMRSVLHQTRTSKLQDLAASGQVDLARPLIEQPSPTSPTSSPVNSNTSNASGMLCCSRCSALFVNQEQLATHQQLYCIFSNPLALFQQLAASQQMTSSTPPTKTPPPTSTTPGPQQHMQQATQHSSQDILSQPRHKTSQMYKHLLESFGFDLVMQFNENHQRRQRKEEEAAAALQAQQEQQKQEQQKQALAAQAAQEKEEEADEAQMDDDVIPELTRSTCQHCNKEFSSVWVLKAHCEEVHRDLVPREFLEKYAQQFKCEYEKKSVVVTVATSSSTTTAPRSSTPAAAQPQDLSSDKESREKEKEESTECKERISRTPEATSTTPTTTPALSNTPVSSTDSATPTVLPTNSHHISQQQQSQQTQQQQQQQHSQLTFAQQMSEMQAALNAMAASQLQQHLQQYPGLMMGMMGLPFSLNVPALAAMNLQPPLVPMMLPPPPYDGAAAAAYPPINQADLLAKQHLALQQQQAAAAANAAASQKRARTRITDEQLKILRGHFDINNSPGEEQILEMAAQSGLPPKVIKHWFRNTLFKERQRNKDSPYNFNNPPSTTLNLEEYEKTGEAKVTPLNSSVSGSSSDDKSPNKQVTPPPMQNASTSQLTEIKQEMPEQLQCQQQQQIQQHQEEQQHHSPGSSGGQQSRPHSPALSMSSVFSGIHHDVSSHPPSTTNAPSTPMLPPKLAPQNFANPTPGTGNVVSNAIVGMALTPQRSLSPGRGPTDYSFGGNSNGSNTSGGSSGKRANRTRFTDYQIKVLQEFFENNAYPKDDDLEYLSKLLGLSPRVIVVWFQNARQKARKVYENQPAAEPVTAGGRENDDGSGRFQRTPGLNYQCKKCLLVFQRYYELIRHQKTHCFKEEDAKRSAQAQAAAAQVAAVLSSEDSNSSSTTTTNNTVANNPSAAPALTEQLQQPLNTATPPHQHQQQTLSQTHQQSQQQSQQQQSQQQQSQTESKESSYQCEKCNLVFGRFELWREHQLVHIMNPSLFPPNYPPDTPFGILQQQALNATSGVTTDTPHPLIAMMQKRKYEDSEEGTGSDNRLNSEHNEQPKDKRLRTTILPEQLDYLYQKYQIESNPSRKMLETIAREVGLKKRVVQVWFQNTRARERKGQFRAHSQVINKRCPFCPALFKVKSALESHLSSKHADQVARGEVNIDNIPDEELSMESAPSNSSTAHMMPPLFPPLNSDMEAIKSIKTTYYEEMKRYFSELANASNGKQDLPSIANHQNIFSSGGESPLDLSKPVDLSRPMKLTLGSLSSLLEEQHSLNTAAHFRGGSDCGPLTDLSERSICDDDSMSETTEFLDDESGPASPASSTQSSRQGPASGSTGNTSGPPVTSAQSSGGNSTGQSGGKRYRTQMSGTQVKVMKSLFSDYKTPTMAECEMLGREIGLPKRVVQVWFQNARAKEKKARLAAGLPAESSAIQPHRGPTGPDECRLCSVRYSAKTPLQEHVFSRRHIESVRVAVEEGSLVPPTPGAPIVPGNGGGNSGGPGISNSPVVATTSQQISQQQQSDENMMYGSVFLHPTAMFQSQQQQQQQQHPAGATASAASTTTGECLADLLDD